MCDQLTLFDVPAPAGESAPAFPPRPAQACMTLGLTDEAADLAARRVLPADLLAVLAGYALAGLDSARQGVVLADLGTGRITTRAALVARCRALAQAQAREAAHWWSMWG